MRQSMAAFASDTTQRKKERKRERERETQTLAMLFYILLRCVFVRLCWRQSRFCLGIGGVNGVIYWL